MDEELAEVSYLTINTETREIVDKAGRDEIRVLTTEIQNIEENINNNNLDIQLLKAQIEYIATQLNIDLSNVSIDGE